MALLKSKHKSVSIHVEWGADLLNFRRGIAHPEDPAYYGQIDDSIAALLLQHYPRDYERVEPAPEQQAVMAKETAKKEAVVETAKEPEKPEKKDKGR